MEELSAYRKDVNDIIGGEGRRQSGIDPLELELIIRRAGAQIEKPPPMKENQSVSEEVSRQLKRSIQVSCSDVMTADEQLAVAQERLETSQRSSFNVQSSI